MSTPYTDEEIAFIREHYTTMKAKDIGKIIGRTASSVSAKAREQGIKAHRSGGGRNFTPEEKAFIKEHYGKMRTAEIAERLGRAERNIRAYTDRAGLRTNRMGRGTIWTDDEIAFLKENYEEHGAAYVGEQLGRSPLSAQCKAGALGMTVAEERAKKIARENIQRAGLLAHTEEARAKMSATTRKIRKAEKRRILFGLQQKTNWKLVREPKKRAALRYKLRKRGYIEDKENRMMYYPPNIRRYPIAEAHAMEQRITIAPLPDDYYNNLINETI